MSMPREEDDSGDRGGKGRLPKLGERIIHRGWTCIEEVQGCHTCLSVEDYLSMLKSVSSTAGMLAVLFFH